MAPERIPQLFQLRAQRFKVIHLPVKTDHIATAGGMHRLVTFWRQIQDGQAPMSQGDARLNIHPGTAIIRSSVSKRMHHLRSEEHTSELQSPKDLVCRLLLE